MVNNWAEKLALQIKKQAPDETASVEVMKFALLTLYNGGTVLIASLTIGALTGMFKETFITLVAFALLRFLSGGYHFESALACFIFSTALMAGLPHLPLPESATLYLNIGAILLLLIFSPSSIKGHTRIPEKYFIWLKVFSILLVCGNIVIDSSILAKAFFTQAVLTVKIRG